MTTPATTGRELWDLLHPLSPEEFIARYWDREPLVLRGEPDKFDRLFRFAFDRDGFGRIVQALVLQERQVLRASLERGVDTNGILRASFDHGSYVAGKGRRPFTQIRPEQMDPLLAAGASIQLGGVESLLYGGEEEARIARCVEAIRSQLHYPGDVLVSATLSPPQARFESHFDPTGAFILQTAGSKWYTFSKRPLLPWPFGKAYVSPDGTVQYTRSPIEDWEEPEPFDASVYAEPVLLNPGDLLYVPPGVVHKTEAGEGVSVGMIVIFGRKTFRNLVDTLLERLMTSNPNWRHLPVWVDATDGHLPEHVQRFLGERLDELRSMLAAIRPDGLEFNRIWHELSAYTDAWPAAEPPADAHPIEPTDVLRVTRSAPLLYATGRDRDGEAGMHLFRGKTEMSVPEDWVPFLRRLVKESRFVASSACAWSESGEPYDWDDVEACLQTLLDSGVLEREAASAQAG